MKKVFQLFHPASAEYVIAHAAYRRAKGKKSTAVGFKGINNPSRALAEARQVFRSETVTNRFLCLATKRPITPRNQETVYQALGLRVR